MKPPFSHPLAPSFEPLEGRVFLAATYYVSASGNDQADGRSSQTAWKSIAHANAKKFSAGDKLLFQGGKTFTVAGSAGGNVVSNAGFESNLSAWSDTVGTAAANGTLTKSSGTVHSGASALKLSGSGDAARGENVTSRLIGNQVYKLSVWTKAVNAGSGDRRVGITFYRAGQKVATFYRGFRNTLWSQTQFEFA